MHYCQISPTIHSWQWADLRFQGQTKSALRSLPGVFRSTFGPKTLGKVGFHLDFNRPLITLWDQRGSLSFLTCYRKWISGRLKITPSRALVGSITNFCYLDTLSCGWSCVFVVSIICHPVHKRGYPVHHLLTKQVALGDFMTILIVR